MDIYLCEPVKPFHTAARSTASFTTKQDVSPQPLPVIMPDKWRQGLYLDVFCQGDFSTTGTPNLTLGFWIGTRDGTITADLALSSVIVTPSGAAAWPWWMHWRGICATTGAAGSLIGQGELQMGSSLTTFAAEVPIPITAALRTVSINTTVERAIGVSGTWGTSSASNIITVNHHRVLILN